MTLIRRLLHVAKSSHRAEPLPLPAFGATPNVRPCFTGQRGSAGAEDWLRVGMVPATQFDEEVERKAGSPK